MPVETVHRTDPEAGTVVVESQVIRLFYNPDPELQEVPNVEGRPLDEARQILAAAGFRVGQETTEPSDDIDEGSVIRTDPAAGAQVEQDTRIDIVVSGGREQVAMPSTVIGRPEAEARQVLESPPYDFTVTTVTEESETVQAGLVIRTNPAAGELVDRGGEVQLVVSGRSAGGDGAERGRLERGVGSRAAVAVQRQRDRPGPARRRPQRRSRHLAEPRPRHRRAGGLEHRARRGARGRADHDRGADHDGPTDHDDDDDHHDDHHDATDDRAVARRRASARGRRRRGGRGSWPAGRGRTR